MQTSNELISLFAGLIASPIFQYIKGKTGWSGNKAYWLALGFSVLVAAGGIAAFGEFDFTPEGIFVSLAAVLGGAQLAFKLIIAPDSLARSFF